MSRRAFLVAVPLAVVLLPGGARAAAGNAHVAVSVDRVTISTQLGRKFVIRSTVANRGAAPARRLIAQLNIFSLRKSVYVDPEDWSSSRVRYLPPIRAGGSTTITWRLQAVNGGEFAAWVTVLPEAGGPRAPAIGPAINVAVAQHKTLNSGGILPLALGIPVLLAFASVGVRLKRRG
jgi:hypothetical protein